MLLAMTGFVKVIVPVEVVVKASRGSKLLPTAPAKVIFAVPVLTVKFCAPLTKLLKAIGLLVVLSCTAFCKIT